MARANGYYAGDFSAPGRSRRPEPSGWSRHRTPRPAETTRPPIPLAA
jgi:hypothetical protein